ncbi:MAG: ABC transporter permease subunit [Alphaproteobacteria bacterium]|nr:MAG: ABC transporter permease subunit [Alphaproteobacteria bacterium]
MSTRGLTGRPTGLSTAALAIYALYLLTPIALILIGSVGEVWRNTLLPNGVTGRWFEQLLSNRTFVTAFWTSLWVCGATVVSCVVIGTPLAYVLANTRSRLLAVIGRVIYLSPVAAPAVVLGFGFMLAFSSESLPFLGSGWLMVAAHTVLCLPYLLQVLIADLKLQGMAELERAAESLGAGFWQRFVDIVLPGLVHSLASASILVAALSIGEFQLTNLIAGFLHRTYPIVLLQAFYGATGFACAATVILLVLALAAAVGGALTSRGATGVRAGLA